MMKDSTIKSIEAFAARNMTHHDGGHDWWHLHRVRNTSMAILNTEGNGNPLIVEISALLHDIGDSKFSNDTTPDSSVMIKDFLGSLNINSSIIDEVIFINRNISFSKGKRPPGVSKEFMIVQDADRLDAIGAIGVARAFTYGGFIHNRIYDPEGKEPSTIAHFDEKLLKLRDLMNTGTGKRLAEERHKYLEAFLNQFFREWDAAAK